MDDCAHGSPTGAGARHRQERHKDRRRMWAAMIVTAVIALAEGVGGVVSGSLALLSDAGHMLTDVSAIGLGLLALWFGSRPADPRRTYGFYRLEILSALLNGLLLLGITAFILFEAYERFTAPVDIDLPIMMLVGTIGLIANLIALSFLHHSHSMTVRGAFLHVVGDTLSSVGVLAGGVAIYFTGWTWVDPALSIAISIIIVVSAVRLVRDAVDVLLEAVPSHLDLEGVRSSMRSVDGIMEVHDLHVWTIASGMYALSAHLVVGEPMMGRNDDILADVKRALVEQYGIDHTTLQIESAAYAQVGEAH